jgi:hypothetical protein
MSFLWPEFMRATFETRAFGGAGIGFYAFYALGVLGCWWRGFGTSLPKWYYNVKNTLAVSVFWPGVFTKPGRDWVKEGWDWLFIFMYGMLLK